MGQRANIWNVNSLVVKDYVESKKDNLENGFWKPEYPFKLMLWIWITYWGSQSQTISGLGNKISWVIFWHKVVLLYSLWSGSSSSTLIVVRVHSIGFFREKWSREDRDSSAAIQDISGAQADWSYNYRWVYRRKILLWFPAVTPAESFYLLSAEWPRPSNLNKPRKHGCW